MDADKGIGAPDGALVLEDGSVFPGRFFGERRRARGEVVFTTSMYGYPEYLTDPSYRGQILVVTHPLVGNYGVPKPLMKDGILQNFESERVQVEALVVSQCTNGKRWDSEMRLSGFLKRDLVPGLEGVDTRTLVKKIRNKGVLYGTVVDIEEAKRAPKIVNEYESADYSKFTQVKHITVHNKGGIKVGVLDFGIKHGILSYLVDSGFEVARFPPDTPVEKILEYNPAGLVISNGPGNPKLLDRHVKSVRSFLEYRLPILGVCLGHQLLSMAMDKQVTKMSYGHRGVNRGVVDTSTGACYITTHNHGYGIHESEFREGEWKPWFRSLDDDYIEGCYHESLPAISVQFHPESRPGVDDTRWVFQKFKKMCTES